MLFSALRSKRHFKVRQKSYFKRALQLIYLYLTVPAKKYNKNQKVILNYLDSSYIDFSYAEFRHCKFDLEEGQLKPLFVAEFLIITAFLCNVKFVQRLLFKAASRITSGVIKTRNIEGLVCGHPDLLISFFGYCLKNHHKEVITIQHGIYNISSYKVLWWEREVATKVILYGEVFKNLYISQGVKEENIIIGNPYFGSVLNASDRINTHLQFKHKKVIFLGQQLYKISESVFTGYNEFLSDFILFYKNKGIEIFYKPHPREDIHKSLNPSNISKLKIYEEQGKTRELFNDFDIYYSVNSSILIELYLQKKICFQVEIPISDFNYDNFGEYTGIPLVNITNLHKHLQVEEYKFYYNPSYLNIRKDYNKYMVDLINGILSNGQQIKQEITNP